MFVKPWYKHVRKGRLLGRFRSLLCRSIWPTRLFVLFDRVRGHRWSWNSAFIMGMHRRRHTRTTAIFNDKPFPVRTNLHFSCGIFPARTWPRTAHFRISNPQSYRYEFTILLASLNNTKQLSPTRIQGRRYRIALSVSLYKHRICSAVYDIP